MQKPKHSKTGLVCILHFALCMTGRVFQQPAGAATPPHDASFFNPASTGTDTLFSGGGSGHSVKLE